MEQKRGIHAKMSYRFLPAGHCCANLLASVFAEEERERQECRIGSLLADKSLEQRYFFAVAGYGGRPVALLQLCRDQKHPSRFRIRGLYTCEQFRRQGLATRLLQLGAKCIFELYGGEEIRSFILPANLSSIAAHRRACFFPVVQQHLQPERHRCFIVRRTNQTAVEAAGQVRCRS